MKELIEADDLEQCLKSSDEAPVLIFKHSTQCPISAHAERAVRNYCAGASPEDPACYVIKVIESRPVSNKFATDLGVEHQSPQLILIHQRKPVWMASHFSITEDAIKTAVGKLASGK